VRTFFELVKAKSYDFARCVLGSDNSHVDSLANEPDGIADLAASAGKSRP
jgi:hypothetical protein